MSDFPLAFGYEEIIKTKNFQRDSQKNHELSQSLLAHYVLQAPDIFLASAGLSAASQGLSHEGEPYTGHSNPDVSPYREEG